MGANISIKEGGKARMFNAARLRTVQPGGGTVDWVPKNDVERSTLYANENGIYSPVSEGVYAFDEVRVNVPEKDSFVGTGSDGNNYQYKKKGGGGGGGGSEEIEVTKLAERIEVTALPLTISYDEGETIEYDGLVVTAYDKNGESMGTVPFNELILPVKTAAIGAWDGSEWISSDGQIASIMVTFSLVTTQMRHLDYPIVTRMYDVYDGTLGMMEDGRPATIGSTNIDDQFTVLFLTRYDDKLYAMRTVGKEDFWLFKYYDNYIDQNNNWTNGWYIVGTSTYKTKTYFTEAPWAQYITNAPESLIDPTNVGSEGFSQSVTIPVKWPNKGDGVELETSFTIFVKPKNMPDTSGVTP